MNKDTAAVGAVLDEYLRFRPNPAHDAFSLLDTALFLEGAFAITLSDAEITAESLGSRDALLHLIERKRGEA